jgi:hypothetical protein
MRELQRALAGDRRADTPQVLFVPALWCLRVQHSFVRRSETYDRLASCFARASRITLCDSVPERG